MKPALLGVFALLAACTGTETGNPSFEGSLAYTSYTSAPQAVALRLPEPGAVTVTAAWLVLGDVRFAAGDDCTDEGDGPIAAHALGAGDHARAMAVSTPLELAAGRYCGVRLPFVRAGNDTGNAPARLAEHSILIEGQLGDGRPFEIRSALSDELLLAAVGDGFDMNDELSTVLIGFDVAIWLDGIDWDAAASDAGGRLAIDERSAPALLRRFEQNVRDGITLYRDLPGSGEVTADSQALAHSSP